MNELDRAEQYLTIPPQYGAELGGLWWSSRRDAIERRDGTTLAVANEVRTVLEGALVHPTVPAFAFVLNGLYLMKSESEPRFAPLRQAYANTRGVTARGRNGGLLIARLCRDLPRVPGAIKIEDVTVALRSLRMYGPHTRPEALEEPPLTRAEFEHHLADQLTHFDSAALVHWLTHGRPRHRWKGVSRACRGTAGATGSAPAEPFWRPAVSAYQSGEADSPPARVASASRIVAAE